MQIERIRELAYIIEKQPHTKVSDAAGFNMEMFEHDCGSPCCIAGFAIHEFNKGSNPDETYSERAREALGITASAARSLFYPRNLWGYDPEPITPTHAASVLRNLADTGKVDWTVGAPVEA